MRQYIESGLLMLPGCRTAEVAGIDATANWNPQIVTRSTVSGICGGLRHYLSQTECAGALGR